MTLAPCYAIENVTLKDASVILYSSLPLATMYISSVFILCLFWKDYFVFTMENPNVFTREVSVFRFFYVAVSYHYLTISYQKKHSELKVSGWLAQ